MRRISVALLAIAACAAIPAQAAADEAVPLYTNEDLDRMFGPPPPTSPSLDKTRPEDWAWVERFLDRQYARIDADRQYDLDRRAQDIDAARVDPGWSGYGQPLAWGLGYPASVWWNTVWGQYSRSVYAGYRTPAHPAPGPYARAMGESTRPMRQMTRGGGGRPGGNPHRNR